MRALARLDGPTLLGEGTVGPLRLPLPCVLYASLAPATPSGTAPDGAPALETLPAAPTMRRGIRLRHAGAALDLTFPIPTPEVAGGEEAPVEAAPRVLLVRTPVSSATTSRLAAGAWDLVVWSNARSALLDSERFVRDAIGLRRACGPAPMIWAPRVATPGRLAFLCSLGVDLLDTTQGLWETSDGRVLGAEAEDLDEGEGPPPPFASAASTLVEEYRAELERVRRFARAGRLRELVESRLVAEPTRGELLRHYDRAGAEYQEEHAPVVGGGTRPYTTKEALRRPEVERFRQRFLRQYRPPPFRSTLLLVPCSKTKPYGKSPSHRRILRALEGIPGAWGIHVVSVTSPLGLVPRELECVPPARHYDIPVTGDWDEDERRWVRDALGHLLSEGRYASVLVHLPTEEYAFLGDLLPEGPRTSWTVLGEETLSSGSLGSLARKARELLPKEVAFPRGGMLRIVREDLRSLAAFQFTDALAAALFEGEVRLAGRPWFQRLLSPSKEDLATWREEVGLWRLTVPGARRVLPSAVGSRVEVRGGIELRGDLFAPGVASADPALRIGDDVILVREGVVLGVGEAGVPGPWMGKLARGRVVKVRHRAHGEGVGPPVIAVPRPA